MNLTTFPEQHFYTSLALSKHHVNLLLQHFYNTSWDLHTVEKIYYICYLALILRYSKR